MTGPALIWKLALTALCCMGLAGCSTYTRFQACGPAQPPRPANYPIPVFTPDKPLPRSVSVLGTISIQHTPFTVWGGTVDAEMKKIMRRAHALGADEVQVVNLQAPGFDSPNFSIQARLLRFDTPWESLAISERAFQEYLSKNRQTLDPIEGIWTDGLPHRLGIIRDSRHPGRDFIAFTLTPDQPNWKPGYKKMDIALGPGPGIYQIKYYRDDFCPSDLEVSLDHGKSLHFILEVGDQSCMMTFKKLDPTSKP